MLFSNTRSSFGAKRYPQLFLCLIFCLCSTMLLQAQQGNVLWSKTYGGNASEIAHDLVNTTDGGLLLVGYTFSDNQDVNQNNGGADIWIVKVDLNGTIIWTKSIGGIADEFAYSIVQAGNNEYIIVGTSYANSNTGNAYFTKIDSDGNQIWEKTYGGDRFDSAKKIIAAGAHFLVTGISYSNANSPESPLGQGDIWLAQMDTDGNILWEKRYGGSRSDIVKGLVFSQDEHIYLSGNTFSQDGHFESNTTGNDESFVLKLSADGDFIWSETYGTASPDEHNGICESLDATKLVTVGMKGVQNTTISGIQGRYQENVWMQAITPSGQVDWASTFGGIRFDKGNYISPANDGGFLLAGETQSFDGDLNGNKGLKDLWVIKTTPFGTIEWEQTIGGTNDDQGRAVLQGTDGHFYVLGHTLSNDIDIQTNKGGEDFLLAKIEGSIVLSLNLGQDQSICVGESVAINPFDNCLNCMYNWNDGFSGVNRTETPTETTNYALTITDQEGNTATDAITISVSPQPSFNLTSADPLCHGALTGTITIGSILGTNPYMYNWSNGSTSPNLENLGADTYTLTITDANNCTATQTSTLMDQPELTLVLDANDANCANATDGQITSVVDGGTLPYSYEWNNGETTDNINNLDAGQYTLTISDANNCSLTESLGISAASEIEIELTADNIGCSGAHTGEIFTTVEGGNQPYNYAWSDGSISENLSEVPAGTYELSITDTNGCTATQTISIEEPDLISIEIITEHVFCAGTEQGIITTTVTGGTAPYEYEWSNGNTTANLDNLTAGVYNLTVSDVNNCTFFRTVTIVEPEPLVLALEGQNIPCFGITAGAINTTVTGGNTPYIYEWSNGSTQANLNDLEAASYMLTLTDVNECQVIQSIEIIEESAVSLAFEVQNINCAGEATGQVTTTAVGGNTPYTFNWDNEASSQNLENLTAGSYTLTLTDNNGCNAIETVTIEEPNPINLNLIIQSPSCAGDLTGQIISTLEGGTSPYNYQWNTGSTEANLTNVGAGEYTLLLTDDNGCQLSETLTIDEPAVLELSLASENVTCFGDETGQINTTIAGGTMPYTYTWNTGDTDTNLENLAAGEYELTLTDENDCTLAETITIESPDSISITLTTAGINCFGDTTGQINSIIEGGISPYQYQWNTGSTDENLTNLTDGAYSLILTDNNNCTQMASVEILASAAIETSIETADISCFGEQDGFIGIEVAGGNPPFDYEWNNGSTTASLENLSSGVYLLTITDNDNCTQSLSQMIAEPAPILITTQADSIICFETTGSIELEVNGGTGVYTYNWNTGETSPNLVNIVADTYSVSVTDMNACQEEAEFILQASEPILTEVNITHPSNGNDNGMIELSIVDGSEPFNINWANGITADNLNNLAEGTYFYTVIDGNGCTLTDSIVLENMVAVQTPLAERNLDVFPNPTTGKVFFVKNTASSTPIQLAVFDTKGRLLDSKTVYQTSNSLDLTEYPSGTYFIRVMYGEATWVERVFKL